MSFRGDEPDLIADPDQRGAPARRFKDQLAAGSNPANTTAAAPSPRSRLALLPDQQQIPDDELLTPEEVAALGMALGDPGEPEGLAEPYDHNENLVLVLSETPEGQKYLYRLGQDILNMIDADLRSREPWNERFRRGLEIMGLKDFIWEDGKAPFEGASTAVHPMISEAVAQSSSRFMEEIFPAAGPVKAKVMGAENPDKRDSADRVQDHMNYQLTIEDTTYFMETQKLSFYLPIYGCAYRKAYRDWLTDRNVLRLVKGEDLIMPYSARSLETSPRITHPFPFTYNEYLKGVNAGWFAPIELERPPAPAPDQTKQEQDAIDSKVPTETEFDVDYTGYETDLDLDVPGFEDESGTAVPYVVTLEKETGKVLRLARGWRLDDPLKRRRMRYSEYWYLPGLGSYGFGLIHMIGGLAEAGTDALRALLDSATAATLQGGFKAKDANSKAGELTIEFGVWKDVDMTAEELDKAFHTPPFREPSPALFQLLEFLTAQAQRFAGTTELMVGEGDSKAPVGTTVAMIEQGSKVYSGVHKRAHFAAGIEFRMLFELNGEYVPAEGYPYLVEGADRQIFAKDYDETIVGVVPVSDPNIFSQTQRIALAQTRYQIWKDNPSYFNGYEVVKSLLKALRDPEVDTVLVDPNNVPEMDPVSENAAMLTGRPVKAKEGENHDLHMMIHMAFAQHPQYGGLPQAQKAMGAAMMAHIAEHLALKYVDTMRALQVPVPQLNLAAPAGTSIAGDEPTGLPGQIAQIAAAVLAQFMQASGLNVPPQQDGSNNPLETLVQESKAMANMGTAAAGFAKAGETIRQGEADAAALDANLHAAQPQQPGVALPQRVAPQS